MKAYGCCVYLCLVHRSKFVKVVLVTSKSRITPYRKQSISKLELLSFLLLVRLINTLKKEFIDSSVAYSWIVNTIRFFQCSFKTGSKKFEIWLTLFVLNLLIQREIQQILFHVAWNTPELLWNKTHRSENFMRVNRYKLQR